MVFYFLRMALALETPGYVPVPLRGKEEIRLFTQASKFIKQCTRYNTVF